jgi:hypothetical protein
MQKEIYQSQINQNFGSVCYTKVCLTFLRLATKLSEMITKFEAVASKFNINRPLTSMASMASKTASTNVFKLASIQCISSKY